MWSAVCSLAPYSQFAEETRPTLCMDKPKRPTSVRRLWSNSFQQVLCLLLLQLACQIETVSAKMEGCLSVPMFILGSLISKRPFQDEAMHVDQAGLLKAHRHHVMKAHNSPTKYQRPHCKQNERSSPLTIQHEALVIILQETHCTSSEKLILPSFALVGVS